MHTINILSLLLLIIGGINWLLVGLAQVDLVAELFGGEDAAASRLVYVLVGLSALWQLIPWMRAFSEGEVHAQRH